MEERLRGRSAVVIGGTHGMGHATAAALVAAGARVVVTGSNASNVARAAGDFGAGATVVRSDVSDPDDRAALAELVRREWGTFEALFVFAGVAEFEPFGHVTEENWDRQFGVNTRGAFFVMQRLAPMINEGGSITVVTVTPATASPGMAAYLGSKAAALAFARVVAAELLHRRIRVNAVAPGFIDTPTLGLASMSPEDRHEFAAVGDVATPMKRHGTVDEIARAALFLAFDATFSTGVELAVDGGLSTVEAPAAPLGGDGAGVESAAFEATG